VRQGIAVFNKELQLICWNRQFGEILDLPPASTRVGIELDDILRFNVECSDGDDTGRDAMVRERRSRYLVGGEPFLERFAARGLVIEVRANRMPDGGIVTTFTDITPSVQAAEALERANETLERRVRERTEELTRLNAELAHAKGAAEEANISKTRFLAAASHDILQPLNAARLYVTSLIERQGRGEDGQLVANIDASLDAVEEIFGALLDISRLDSGAMRPELVNFRIDEMFRQLDVEFSPMARERGLELKFVRSALSVRSDRRLLRRILQNLVSNAVKYTQEGQVLVGCRRHGGRLRIDVYDTGLGIPQSKQRDIFKEFHRLDQGAKIARGLGLGLSIVERSARVLDHKVTVTSRSGRGSHFSVEVPLAAANAAPAPDGDVVLIDVRHLALLDGWGCRILKAATLQTALAAVAQSQVAPNGLLVDYHLDEGDGLSVISELRRRFGMDLPAILITADRSPRLREQARVQDVQVLNKPIKPAALRALLTQWSMQRVAAAE
jgi:signal transduction histidine kinase/CheY-like chemotaxis protein